MGSRDRAFNRPKKVASGVGIAIVSGLVACLGVVVAGIWMMSSSVDTTVGRVGEALVGAGVIALVIFAVESTRDHRREKGSDRRAFLLFLATNSDLRGVDLSGADLRGLDLRGRDLRNANLNFARLDGADISFANMAGVRLRYASLRGALLDHADLRLSDVRHSDLVGAQINHADARGALFGGSRLVRASATHAKFHSLSVSETVEMRRRDGIFPIKWYFEGNHAGQSSFDGVDARNGDFRGANFSNADMTGTDFTFARLFRDESSLRARLDDARGKMLLYLLRGDLDAILEWSSHYSIDRDRDNRAMFAGAEIDGVMIDADAIPELELSKEQLASCRVVSVIPRPRRWVP